MGKNAQIAKTGEVIALMKEQNKKINIVRLQNQNIEVLRNHPMRETFVSFFNNVGMHHLAEQIETGQESRPKTVSLQEKKTFYREVFDDMNEILTAFKNRLETMRSSDKRIAELLERIEKCEKELCRICDIMGRF